VPLNADEDELIWRCDMSAGVTRVDLVDQHYYSGRVTKEICREFCRIHDEYRRRMIDYIIVGRDE
jgi:hypothetical protein